MTWRIGDGLIRDGRRGLLFSSQRYPGGTNVVVFSGNLASADRVEVHDPGDRLPHDLLVATRRPVVPGRAA